MTPSSRFDVAIIGSGIGGSTLAAILARQGLQVVVFEAGSHPRFAIGESMILETSEMMRALAELYQVPEIAYFSSENFLAKAGSSHGVKRHFGYLHHIPGETRHEPDRALQAVIPRQPHGHELHLFRQDADAFMAACAVQYGATLLQQTPVQEVICDASGVEILTNSGARFQANYVVDAGGFRSLLAHQFGLRTFDQRTHSRAQFTHMIGVQPHACDGPRRREYGLPFPMHQGTLHHVFDGGWLWVIPFNNHKHATNPLVSVGLLLDPRRHPWQPDEQPEEAFHTFLARFPDIAQQFRQAKAVRPWVRAPRIQYGSTQIVGDRWALLGHAAGFIDPLYSKGLYASLTAVMVLADLLLRARETGDYSEEAFRSLEVVTQNFLDANDRLVANSYRAFGHPRLWQVYAPLWLLGAYTEYVMLNCARARARGDRREYIEHVRQLRMVGGGFPPFRTAADQIDEIMEAVDPSDGVGAAQAAARICDIYRELDWMPTPFLDLLDGKTHLPKGKLRLGLLAGKHSFMGAGAYRRHFFGEHTAREMVKVFLQEKIRYSSLAINRGWQPAGRDEALTI